MSDKDRDSVQDITARVAAALTTLSVIADVEDWGAHFTSPSAGILPGYYEGDLRVTLMDGRHFRLTITEEKRR